MNKSKVLQKRIKLFTLQNLLLESDLANLEKKGISIGHLETIKKDELVDVELFDYQILESAKRMANFYVLYYSLENTIRKLIEDRLKEKYQLNWWEEKVPSDVKIMVDGYKKKEKDTTLSSRTDNPLIYTNFGDLIKIIEANWDDFSDTIKSKKVMGQILSQFNQLRDIIAHSCELSDDDITRFKLLIKDWLRAQA